MLGWALAVRKDPFRKRQKTRRKVPTVVLSQAVPSFPCLSSLVVFKSNGFKLCPAQFQDLKAQMGTEEMERKIWPVPSPFNSSN